MILMINGKKLYTSFWNDKHFIIIRPEHNIPTIKRELKGKIKYKFSGSSLIPNTDDDYNMLVLLYGVY